MTPEKKEALTLDLTKAMIGIENVTTRLNVLAKDLDVKFKVKKSFNDWSRMMERIKTEFRMYFDSLQDRNVIETLIFNDEISLQIEAITDYLLALPKEKRDEFEEKLELEIAATKSKADVHS